MARLIPHAVATRQQSESDGTAAGLQRVRVPHNGHMQQSRTLGCRAAPRQVQRHPMVPRLRGRAAGARNVGRHQDVVFPWTMIA